MQRKIALLGLFFPVALTCIGAAACKKSPASGSAQAQGQATTHGAQIAAPTTPPPRTGQIETVEVPNDKKVLVVLGDQKTRTRPIIHLHGMCAEAKSDLQAWSGNASSHGTVIALSGDTACPNQPGMNTWTMDARAIDARISTAIRAVSAARDLALEEQPFVIVGESMGASRATALADAFPAKYTRLVLVGAPEVPSAKSLGSAKAIALLAGENEPQGKMKQGLSTLTNAGLTARFWELPDAMHGEYGSEGNQRMSEAIAFVAEH